MEELLEGILNRLFVPMEASGRHVHVTMAQSMALFGHELTPQRPLSQPGQFLARERVVVQGPKGKFTNVAVLGPERPEGQGEFSLTDGKILGMDLPVRLSGDTDGAPVVTLTTDRGQVQVPAICARRHIHLDPESAKQKGVSDKQVVKLKALTDRPVVFEDVVVRVHRDFAPAVHLDYDEANGCGFQPGDWGLILHG